MADGYACRNPSVSALPEFIDLSRETPLQRQRAQGKAGVVDAMAQARDIVCVHRHAGRAQGCLGVAGAGDRDDVVRLAMDQQHRHRRAAFGRQRLGGDQRAGIGQDGARRGGAAQAAYSDIIAPWLKPISA